MNQTNHISSYLKRINFTEKIKLNKDSHFTDKKVISILTNDGRITLNDNQVKIIKGETEAVINFNSEEFNSKLKQYFNIKL